MVKELAAEVAAAKLDRKALAALSAGLQQFQEDALGVNVCEDSPTPPICLSLDVNTARLRFCVQRRR